MANRRTAELSKTEDTDSTPSSRPASESSKANTPTEQKNLDFEFLNFSHPSQAKGSRARKTVRSHVTKQQHQKEHAAAAARRAKSYPQPDGETSGDSPPAMRAHAATFPPNRPTLELPSRSGPIASGSEQSSQSPSPLNSPSSATDRQIDLYDLYPEEWHQSLPIVMDHYFATMASDVPDLDGPEGTGLLRSRFLPLCMTDRASLHGVVLMAASHYKNQRGAQSHPIDVLQLRGMAFREINKALEDPARATSDQLIAAVAKMAAYEAVFGDREVVHLHMAGLRQMVMLRGGLQALGLDGLLERILLWIDSNAAHITNSQIIFDKATFPSSVKHPRPDPQRFTGRISQRPSP